MSKGKRLFLIGLALAGLMLSSIACDESGDTIVPGDGQVGEAVTEGYNGIRDAASEIKDAVDATGDGLEIGDNHGTVIIDSLWDVAKEIAAE